MWRRLRCSVQAAVARCTCPTQPHTRSTVAVPQVVSIMEREGIQRDVITYNSLIKAAAAAGLLPHAVRTYRELAAAGLRPTTFTYAALFTAAAKARHGDAAWLLRTWDEMEAAGVAPNNYVVSALFSAASHAPCTPAQLDRLFAALALLRRCVWEHVCARGRHVCCCCCRASSLSWPVCPPFSATAVTTTTTPNLLRPPAAALGLPTIRCTPRC